MKNNEKINVQQKKIIWAIWKRKIMLEDGELYTLIGKLFNKSKMSDLSFVEADVLISQLRRQTGEVVAGKITRKQQARLSRLQKSLGWSDNELAGFVKKQTKVEHWPWLTPRQASKVITGLIKYQRWLTENRR